MGLNLKLNTNQSDDASKSLDDQTYDELKYDTWFSGNDLAENICTHVPFSKYEKKTNETSGSEGKDVIEYSRFNQQQENMEVSNERQMTRRLPPYKKMRSSIETFFIIEHYF
jgi:hypothetical protein